MSDRKLAAFTLTAILVFAVLIVGFVAGIKEFTRYQRVQDAKNRTRIVHQDIKTATQRAQVIRAQNEAVRARAEQRVIEAEGIRKAQDKIAATLTPLYIQHEAIQAQRAAKAQKVYIPAGNQGVPLVNDIGK